MHNLFIALIIAGIVVLIFGLLVLAPI